eukprot:g13001.t1
MDSSSLALRPQHLQSGSGSTAAVTAAAAAATTTRSTRRPATTTTTTISMVLGGVGGEGLTAAGSALASAVGQAHASAMGSGLGSFLLLADEEAAPPNIFGEVAQGGLFIIFSGVFSAYIMATLIRNMPLDQLEAITAELGGGVEIEEIEAQRIETAKRFKELTKEMELAVDPTMGVKPDEQLSKKLTEQTAKAMQTDIASIEDEYED